MDKRRKLTSSDVQIVDEVEEDVYFKINFERYTIRWRNAVGLFLSFFFFFFIVLSVCPLMKDAPK